MNHKPFLETIAKHPADMGPRLVYADWLEERGDVRAEYIRLAIELANPSDCKTCGGKRWYEIDDLDSDDCIVCTTQLKSRCAALLAEHRREWTMTELPDGWGYVEDATLGDEICTAGGTCGDQRQLHIRFDFRAGFPEVLTLRWQEWQAHYQTLIDAMPVRCVNLTTMPNVVYAGRSSGYGKGKHQRPWHIYGMDKLIWRHEDCERDRLALDLLAAEFPGHDPEHPIKYTLPHGDGGIPLPRGIDPRTVVTINEARAFFGIDPVPHGNVPIGGNP